MNSESYKNDRLKKEDKIEFSLNHSCVLAKNTIIDCKGFSVKLKYVKKTTSSFILYQGTKIKGNLLEDVEIVELFTYRDKRDINGKNRISPKATMCIHGKEDIPFYNLISVDTGFETSLIFDIFRRGHKSYENFICANETYYYIMKNESENYCKRCFHIYNVENNYCPYCGIRVNEKISKLKSLLTLFK